MVETVINNEIKKMKGQGATHVMGFCKQFFITLKCRVKDKKKEEIVGCILLYKWHTVLLFRVERKYNIYCFERCTYILYIV